jgi:replicative DNA helicase
MPDAKPDIPVAAVGWCDLVSPLRAGCLYLVRCQPGAGKSLLALGLIRSLVARPQDPVRVAYLSVELCLRDVELKWLTAMSGLPFKAIDLGTLSPAHANQIERLRLVIAGWPLDLIDSRSATIDQIVTGIRQCHLTTPGGVGVAMVDYIDAASPGAPDLSPAGVRFAGLKALKALAVELAIPVVVMAAPAGEEPDPADALLDLNLPEDGEEDWDRGWREVSLLLLRSNDVPTGGVRLMFYPGRMVHREWPVAAGD